MKVTPKSTKTPIASVTPIRKKGWPVLNPAALYGLPGEVVRTIEPESEADPVALLLSFLTVFGCLVGPDAHAVAGSAEHPARLFSVIVGDTSRARKGTAF